MKKLLLILVALLAVIGWLFWPAAGVKEEPSVTPAIILWEGAAATTTINESDEIFKKAFWRRPAPEDEILHAERHEWSDAEGLLRWQWFLVVDASPALIQYLREDNAFGLLPVAEASTPVEAPTWFRFEPRAVSTWQSPHGGMQLMFSENDNKLYATGSGRGLTRGAPEPAPPALQGAPNPGRLPTRSPPIPES